MIFNYIILSGGSHKVFLYNFLVKYHFSKVHEVMNALYSFQSKRQQKGLPHANFKINVTPDECNYYRREEGKDQELIQSSTIPDLYHCMGK